MTRRQLRTRLILVVGLSALAAGSSAAYVPNTLDFVGAPVIAHWPASAFPIPTRVTPGLTTDISDGSDRTALDRAMATWSAVADSQAAIFIEREQDVQANVLDGVNAIEFSNDPSLDGAGFVSLTFLLTDADGTIREADMLVNDRRTGFTTQEGSDVGLDLETTMLREVGRLLGLSSSPTGGLDTDRTVLPESAVMFAVSRGIGQSARALQADDIAGIAAMYPQPGSRRGEISGRVTRAGEPVFGAHVVAHDPVQDTLVGAVTLPDGSYRIGGLPPGRYVLQAIPLTGLVTPAALGGIFAGDGVDTGFRATFFSQTVRVGPAQRVDGVSVEVQQ